MRTMLKLILVSLIFSLTAAFFFFKYRFYVLGQTCRTSTEVAPHNTQSNCWIIISGNVYNVTTYINIHPGGVNPIASRCGTNATTAFTTSTGGGHIHSNYAYTLLPPFLVGPLCTTAPSSTPTPSLTPTLIPTAVPTTTRPTPTKTPTSVPPTATPSPSPTPFIPPSCTCASNLCDSTCSFDKYADISYNPFIRCDFASNIYNTTPQSTDKTGWCKRVLRTRGDADGNGRVENIDYYYYVQVVNGGKVPTSVLPDFNGDGEVGSYDRAIITKSLIIP